MTAPACGCGRPCPDAFLCRDCASELRTVLVLAASIAADLRDAVARQLNLGPAARQPGKPEPPLPFDLHAMVARARLLGTLAAWAKAVAGRDVSTVAGGAITLDAHLEDLRQHPDAWRAAAEIAGAVMAAVAVIDRRPDLRPAGDCEACGTALRAEPSANTAICRCGHVTTGIAQRRAERAAAADLLGTATEIAGQLAMIGVRVSAGTIRMWASRGRLSPRPGSAALPFYAMSDVLVLVADRDSRKAS
jgi:hypothetical protein